MAVVAGAAALTIGALGASAASAQAATFRCEASALRGTVAGASVEPSVAGRGTSSCKTSQSGLSVPLPALLSARSVMAATVFDEAKGSALASGGVADLGVAVPADALAPILAQLDTAIAAVPAIGVPALPGVSIDLGQQLRALAPGLPAGQLLSAQVVDATATGSCQDGRSTLAGASQVAGVKLLGADLPVNGAVEQVIKVFGGGVIDPSKIDPASLVPATVPAALTSLVAGQIKTVLDALPEIPIPTALADVHITPGEQVRDGDTLTQRALRVSATVAGTPLLDLVLGEAKVGVSGSCAQAAAGGVADQILRCTDRKLVLVDVLERRGRVKLLGAANRDYVGRKVNIRLRSSNRIVAHAKVRRDGSFSTTAALPPRAVRFTNRARYRAEIRRERSLPLKLHRRMVVERMTARHGKVTIAGRVIRPLASPVRAIALKRRVSCHRMVLVKRFMPRSDGRFRVTVKAPKGQTAAVYRLQTRVRKFITNPKTYPTFTLPRGVNLDKR